MYVWTLACLGWIRPPLTSCLLAWRNLYWFCLFNLTRRALAWRLSSTKEPKKTLSMIRLKVDTSVRGRFSCEKISWSWHFWLAPDSLSWLCFSCERFSCCWKDCFWLGPVNLSWLCFSCEKFSWSWHFWLKAFLTSAADCVSAVKNSAEVDIFGWKLF